MADSKPTSEPASVQLRPRMGGIAAAYLAWRVTEKVTVAASGCWEWTGATDAKGYGVVHLTRHDWPESTVAVHRLVYNLCVGNLVDGMCICHHCDNPACVRPDHLFQGTTDDNIADKLAKGRQRSPIGEAHGSARLTAEGVILIRGRVASGESYASIARDLHFSETTIADAAKGKTWSHIPGAIGVR